MLYCEKCKKETKHKILKKFKNLLGYKYWYGCTKCNTIQVIENEDN